ncbi:hypothetical protein [Flavilitoribacter nigricans]|uniref:Uncharacterized protein n=1 Tax=Flavilitoribacter nigricans (strain ATCC 23147 / DSM 23189 / NBRC 102662 / NCIMB 1420 / SS-2) TaxID=1122177 RepID=A0A2D0N464_FLAN2|nr:hypothetical protein [Flavilitoribacter nigricans]PHN03342.1 hypothetical protein CRP01_27035 [Flavilitoribacter nigricans DSM 23189 = NBRC 102662]
MDQDQLRRHGPKVIFLLLALLLLFLLWPDLTDTGEEKEKVLEDQTRIEQEEQAGIESAEENTTLKPAPELRDEIREVPDTIPTNLDSIK